MNQKIKLFLVSVSILLISSQFCYGQKIEAYDSLLVQGENLYQANFSYYVVKEDTLYHGPFSLTKQIEEANDENKFYFSAINGSFTKHIADGLWTVRQGNFVPQGKGAIKDYYYAFKISGREFAAKGTIDNGIKDSPWEIYEWEIGHSTIKDTILSATLPFKDDFINGPFSFYHQGEYLEGSIDNHQLTEKTWSFYTTDKNGMKVLTKEWVFSDNQLVKKVLYENGKSLDLNIGGKAKDQDDLEEVDLNSNYLKILDLSAAVNDPVLFEKYKNVEKVSDLFFAIIEKFQIVDSTFRQTTGVKISPTIKSKIQKFPYTQEELAFLDSLQHHTHAADSVIQAIKQDPQVNIARLSTRDVAIYIAVLDSIYNQLLQRNMAIVEHYQNGNLEYIDRAKYITNNINFNTHVDVLTAFNSDTVSISYSLDHIHVDKSRAPTQQLIASSEGIYKEVQLLSDSIQTFIQEIKHEENLIQIETALIEKYEMVKSLTDSLINEQHQNLAGYDIKAVLIDFTDQILKNYSSLSLVEDKAGEVEPALECLNHVETLLYSLQVTPENSYKVRDAYTNKVFNPYTYTEMEEKVKPPIYKSYSETILPAMFENLKKMDCNNITSFSNNFSVLFDEMINILKRKTAREERRIGRTRSASKAAEILNIDLTFN